jgi:hypothetical protein
MRRRDLSRDGAAETTVHPLQRRRITVLDREDLESCACECYAVVNKEYDRPHPEKLAK